MSTARNKGRFAFVATAVGVSLALSGCGSSDPLADPDEGTEPIGSSDAIVVGSQAYASNEIIAEIYAQALEAEGIEVTRQFNIGQRDAYMPSIESGEVDLFPDYTGNVLQFFDPDATATSSDEVYDALTEVLPESIVALEQSPATDQDSYTVTSEYAEENDLTTIADLADVDGAITLGGPAELEERPYGPTGLEEKYGVTVDFSATGNTTVQNLIAGEIQVGNVYTSDYRISSEDLVVLEDPEGLFLASNVVPLASADVADEVRDVIDAVSAALTPEGLVELNLQNSEEQRQADELATEWLEENGLS